MKSIVVITLAALLLAGAGPAQSQSPVAPASVYHLSGMTVVSPDQPGWELSKSDGSEIVFEKRDKDRVCRASVTIIKTAVYDTDKDLLAGLEALKQRELDQLDVDSIHFNYTGFNGRPGLHYDGIVRLDRTSSPGFGYLNFKGRLIPYPGTPGLAVKIEFSDRSKARGFSDELLSFAERWVADQERLARLDTNKDKFADAWCDLPAS